LPPDLAFQQIGRVDRHIGGFETAIGF